MVAVAAVRGLPAGRHMLAESDASDTSRVGHKVGRVPVNW